MQRAIKTVFFSLLVPPNTTSLRGTRDAVCILRGVCSCRGGSDGSSVYSRTLSPYTTDRVFNNRPHKYATNMYTPASPRARIHTRPHVYGHTLDTQFTPSQTTQTITQPTHKLYAHNTHTHTNARATRTHAYTCADTYIHTHVRTHTSRLPLCIIGFALHPMRTH